MSHARADEAARCVLDLFGGRVCGFVPGTHIAAVARPVDPPFKWVYWWQAHLLDCLVDAVDRESRYVRPSLLRRQRRGIWVRNVLHWRNRYYDDMAWLALAADRAGMPVRRLDEVLRRALTDDVVPGGAVWTTSRDYKNTAATGPIALHLARRGDHRTAAGLLDWLRRHLAHPDTGLFRDGLRREQGELVMNEWVFSYNQGPVLGVMLELGDEANLASAAEHIEAISTHLTHPGTRILRTHDGDDGGLFTGILTRYLALAATDSRLPDATRSVARELIEATAENLWQGRVRRGWRGVPVTVFPENTSLSLPPVVECAELSTQLQAWMSLEAVARLS